MQAFTTLLAILALVHSALAGVYITGPVATTVGIGGQVLTVTWADDGKTPSVGAIGPSSIDLYTGSQDQQTWLQNIAASVDVSKASSVTTTISPTVGQSGAYYFVRFRSLGLQDTTNPQYNYQAYSAKFTLNSMTGTWNSTVLAQLAAAGTTVTSSSPISASTASKAATASASASSIPAKSAASAELAAPGLLMALVAIAGYYAL